MGFVLQEVQRAKHSLACTWPELGLTLSLAHTSHTLKGDVKQGFNLVYDSPKWATSKLPAVTFRAMEMRNVVLGCLERLPARTYFR
jgi:hypothetical protein